MDRNKPYHSDNAYITAAGGTKQVAHAMLTSMPVVSLWRRVGISAFKRWRFLKFCEELGVELPENFMELK